MLHGLCPRVLVSGPPQTQAWATKMGSKAMSSTAYATNFTFHFLITIFHGFSHYHFLFPSFSPFYSLPLYHTPCIFWLSHSLGREIFVPSPHNFFIIIHSLPFILCQIDHPLIYLLFTFYYFCRGLTKEPNNTELRPYSVARETPHLLSVLCPLN